MRRGPLNGLEKSILGCLSYEPMRLATLGFELMKPVDVVRDACWELIDRGMVGLTTEGKFRRVKE